MVSLLLSPQKWKYQALQNALKKLFLEGRIKRLCTNINESLPETGGFFLRGM
jgi:hypothetical protein